MALAEAGSGGATSETLIDAIWGADVPTHPQKALHVLVSRVRSATAAEVVVRTDAGYRLGLAPDEVDLLAQDQSVVAAQRAFAVGDAAAAVEQARTALGFGPDPRARRIAAVAASQLGRHEEVIDELEELLRRKPYDEEILAQLLRALAATQSPGAALARFDAHRRQLTSTLGIDPGPTLQAVHRELLAADRPVKSGLRFAATSLLGRDRDVERLQGLLATARLVSIVGAGGLGKTRLAQVLASKSARPAVHVVELAGISTPGEVDGAVAAALSLRETVAHRDRGARATDPRTRLAAHLRGTPSLLVLDNCEHVIDTVAELVAFLLAQVSDLRVLTTSRAPLRLTAEHVYLLEQLDVEDAVELFGHRARAVRPNVTLDGAVATELVERLDGLPLAIELAAAKARTLSVTGILANLSDRFALLRTGDRSAPDRHQTLYAVIDWSWQLLDAPSQDALMYLSVFPDGFTSECAESVLGLAASDAVEQLVDQSLVTVTERHGMLRYRMLETVREFGRARLAETGLAEEAKARQHGWAQELCRGLLRGVHGPEQLEVMDSLRPEEANLAEALRGGLIARDERVVPVLAALTSYWMICGDYLRIFNLVDSVESFLRGWRPPTELAEPVRLALSVLTITRAVFPTRRKLPEVHRTLRQVGPASADPFVRALSHVADALHSVWRHQDRDTGSAVERLLDLTHSSDRFVVMLAAPFLASALENSGAVAEAIAVMSRGLAQSRPGDAPWLAANYRVMLAQLHAQLGEHERAAGYAGEALPVMELLGATEDGVLCQTILAVAALALGDLEAATSGLDSVTETQRRGQGFSSRSVVLLGQAELAFAQGHTARGLNLLDTVTSAYRSAQIPGFPSHDGLEPWTLLVHASVVAVRSWHDPASDARVWEELLAQGVRASDPGRDGHDYPVLGTVVFALASWGLRHQRLGPADTAMLLALADRLGYNRFLPSLRWRPLAEELASCEPDLLARSWAALAAHQGSELVPVMHKHLTVIACDENSSPTTARRL